jgi:serine/threonine protein phosphatase PrpC
VSAQPLPACSRCDELVGPHDRFCEACGMRRPDPRDHVEVDAPGAAAVSDRGHRHQHNEDAVAVRVLEQGRGVAAVLAVVCDGVSHGPRPDLASHVAAEAGADALVTLLRGPGEPEAATRGAVRAAADAVAALADRPNTPGSPACTFVSAVLAGRALTVGWVGDSRAYWIPSEPATPGVQLTEDDSWLAATVAAGTMSYGQAAADRRAHAITAWLGADAGQVRPRVTTVHPGGPGAVLVCTDGLWNYLDSPAQLAAALPPDAAHAPLRAARQLVRTALRRGGRDNVTVAVLPVAGPPETLEEDTHGLRT